MNRDTTERPIFAHLQYGVRQVLDVSWGEYVLLDMIYWLSNKNGYCYKSTSAIASDLGITFNGTKYMLNRLTERELIIKTPKGYKCGQAYLNLANMETIAKSAIQSTEDKLQKVQSNDYIETENSAKSAIGLQKVQSIAKSSDKNNSIDIHKTNTHVDSPTAHPRERTYKSLFIGIVEALGFSENVKPTDGRIRKLKLRNKTYSYDDLIKSARNLGGDAYMQGDNPSGKRYGDIDYFLRNDEIIDKYLNKNEVQFTEGEF